MAKYIVQHRRGTAEQWAEQSTIIPREGEIVIEIDEANSLHKLKIGDGIHTYAELAYLMAGDEIVSQVLAQAKPRVITIELTSEWSVDSEGKYRQVVALNDITEYSRLDLQPTADMIEEFKQLGLVFVTENNGGTITVCSVGNVPLKSYTMQATIVETECDKLENSIIGIPVGAPIVQTDWAQTDESKADYIKNKPEGTLATQEWVNGVIAGKVDYLGTVNSADDLTAKVGTLKDSITAGDYFRASADFDLVFTSPAADYKVHAGDLLIAKIDNPEYTSDYAWDIIHTEDPGNYVSLAGYQEITGSKLFTGSDWDYNNEPPTGVLIDNNSVKVVGAEGVGVGSTTINYDGVSVRTTKYQTEKITVQGSIDYVFPYTESGIEDGTYTLATQDWVNNWADNNVVTLDTEQIITGLKTFDALNIKDIDGGDISDVITLSGHEIAIKQRYQGEYENYSGKLVLGTISGPQTTLTLNQKTIERKTYDFDKADYVESTLTFPESDGTFATQEWVNDTIAAGGYDISSQVSFYDVDVPEESPSHAIYIDPVNEQFYIGGPSQDHGLTLTRDNIKFYNINVGDAESELSLGCSYYNNEKHLTISHGNALEAGVVIEGSASLLENGFGFGLEDFLITNSLKLGPPTAPCYITAEDGIVKFDYPGGPDTNAYCYQFAETASSEPQTIASREWVQAQNFGFAPVTINPNETEAGYHFNFSGTDDFVFEDNGVYLLEINQTPGLDVDVVLGSLTFRGINLNIGMPSAHCVCWRNDNGERSAIYPNTYVYAYGGGQAMTIEFDTMDISKTLSINPTSITLTRIA